MSKYSDKLTKKQRHQVKSRWYYIFWGTATFAVVAGQLYVGTGYRLMSGAMLRIMDSIEVYECHEDEWNRERFY